MSNVKVTNQSGLNGGQVIVGPSGAQTDVQPVQRYRLSRSNPQYRGHHIRAYHGDYRDFGSRDRL